MKWNSLHLVLTYKRCAKYFFAANFLCALWFIYAWTYFQSTSSTCKFPYACSKQLQSSKLEATSRLPEHNYVPQVSRYLQVNHSSRLAGAVLQRETLKSTATTTDTSKKHTPGLARNVTSPLESEAEIKTTAATDERKLSVVTSSERCKWSCTDTNWIKNIKPLITLDPDKFLYPGLVGGPNNQLSGLWDSIYLAIRLNRTLVAPIFYGHQSNFKKHVKPSQRIDVDRLRRFVSTISLEQLRAKCHGAFGVVLRATETSKKLLKTFEMDTKMKVFVKDDKNVPLLINTSHLTLPGKKYKPRYGSWITSDEKFIRDAFGTSASCAIFTSPFNSVNVKPSNGQARPLPLSISPTANISQVPDKSLFAAVVAAVRRPPCLVAAATDYVKAVFRDEPYVAVHWRYDKNDWYMWHCVKSFESSYATACRYLPKITAHDVAQAIAGQMHQWGVTGRRFIYIASPPSLQNFTKQIYVSLGNGFYPMNESQTLISFLRNNYGSCWSDVAKSMDVGEVISLTEMEIMVESSWFFHSQGSTWSSNTRPLRHSGKINGTDLSFSEEAILKLAQQAMLKRTSDTIPT